MSEESLKQIQRARDRLTRALYAPESHRTPEDNRMRAYLKAVGIDVDDPAVMKRFSDNTWPTSHWDDPPLSYQALSPALDLTAGEEAYRQRADLGRQNPGADATAVANPTLSQLSLRNLYQTDDRYRSIQPFPKRIR